MKTKVANSSRCPWLIAAVVLLAAFTGYTRLSAPWNMVVTVEGMLHLESWRNRYGTDDIYPIFVRKLETMQMLDGERLDLFKRAYEGSTLFQRGLLLLSDLHPPAFPLLAEISAALTDSSLIAVRMISAVSSILAVLLAYRLGRRLLDATLGLWLATLLAIGTLIQVYAGIARPYALAQCALVIAWIALVREQRGEDASPWRFWLAALFAQSTSWLAWSIVGPMVLVVTVSRLRRAGPLRLLASSWWYVMLSLLLLLYMAVQLINPVTGDAMKQYTVDTIWWQHCMGSPFAAIDLALGLEPLTVFSPSGILLLLFFGMGAACMLADHEFIRRHGAHAEGAIALPSVRLALFLALGTSMVISIAAAGGTRMMVIYSLVPTIIAAVGLRWLLRGPRVSRIAIVGVLILFAGIRAARPIDLFEMFFANHTRFDLVARRLADEIGPNDRWCGFPSHWANCLYRYAELPEPIVPITRREYKELVATLPDDAGAVFVFASRDLIEPFSVLRRAPVQWEFVNDFVLVKVAPRAPRPARGPRGAR